MKRLATLLLAAAAALSVPAAAQDISFTGSEPLQLPRNVFFGAVAGGPQRQYLDRGYL